MLGMGSAQAFKPETHVWVGQQVINDLADDGRITILLRGQAVTIDVPPDVVAAILNNKSEYLLGNIGPDSAPDILVGQTIIHPGMANGWKTNDWLQYLIDSSRNNAPGKAYTYGYLGHASADMFSHTYVNQYAGDIFDLSDETLVEERHIALEGFIAKLTPPLADHTGKPLGPVASLVKPTEGFAAFARDTMVMNDTVYGQYNGSKYGQHLAAYYKYRKGIATMANQGVWMELDNAIARAILAKFDISLSKANTQVVLDKINLIIPKLQRKEDNVQALANDMLNAAQKLDDQVFAQVKSSTDSVISLERALLDLHLEISRQESKLRNTVGCPNKYLDPVGYYSCKEANEQIDKLNSELNGLISSLYGAADKKRAELLAATYATRDATVAAQTLVQIVANASIDFSQRLGSNTSPIKAALLGWGRDVDAAMLEYPKATSQMVLNSTDPAADAFAPMQRWYACYHMSILGIPQELSDCTIQDGAKNMIWAVERAAQLADDLASLNNLLGLPAPSDIRRWRDEQIEAARNELISQIYERLLPPEVRTVLALYKNDMTDANLNAIYTRPESRFGKNLLMIPDLAARVRAEMSLQNGAFDPQKYAVARNSVTLAKLALLDKAGLTRLGQLAGAPLDAGGRGPFDATDNIVAGAFASIDGNHQWMQTPAPRPNAVGAPYLEAPSYAGAAGFVPWQDKQRGPLFRGLFTGPLSPGVDAPRAIGMPALLKADYPYQPCAAHPFPNDNADRTCRVIEMLPSLMQLLME